MSVQSHFFIESGGFPQQNQDQSFGPISDSEFRLTSKFTLSNPKKAFAVCKGQLLIQPQAGTSDKVNLILRPYKQPFPGLNVKYFVYRGLQRGDFFTSDFVPKIIPKAETTSDFINKINEDFHAFHDGRKDADGNTIPLPDFSAKFIGYNPAFTDETLLVDLFFKANTTLDETNDFDLPMIDMGKSLGSFASGECGIDVVLDYGDYKHDFDNGEFVFDLGYARATEAKIILAGTDFNKKLQREQIRQFIDIATFYGMFVNDDKVIVTNASGETNSKVGVTIYNEVLSPFFNKNKVYLYIQSDLKRSYNFYDNYKLSDTNINNLKFGVADNLVEGVFGDLNWPIHIFDSDQNNSNTYNDISIQLISSSSYEDISSFLSFGTGDFDKGFITKENLIDPQNTDQDINFSKVISFKVPNIEIDGIKKNISSLIQLIYVGKEINIVPPAVNSLWDDRIRGSLYNNLFPNIDIVSIFPNSKDLLIAATNKFSLISYDGFSNLMKESVLQGYVAFQKGIKSVVQADLTEELLIKEKVLFISKKTETLDSFSIHDPLVLSKNLSSSNTNISAGDAQYSGYFTTLYGSKDYSLTHTIITENGVDIKLLSLNNGDSYDYCYYNLGITKDELDRLKVLIPNKATNINIHVHDELENPYTDDGAGTAYFKYSLGIYFEDSTGEISVLFPVEPIYVYGLSHKFLASGGYSDFEEKSVLDNNDIIIKG